MTRAMMDFKLYLITDRKLFTDNDSFFRGIEEALKGGVKAVQLREKDLETRELVDMAYRMREVTNQYSAKLFINERVDVALAVEADGVHLGVNGIPVKAARKIDGNSLLIGVSAHSVAEAGAGFNEGADFITAGPVYETASKARYGRPVGLEVLSGIKKAVTIPVFAIGGIKTENISEVFGAGADGIALISGILASPDIKTKSEEFMRLTK